MNRLHILALWVTAALVAAVPSIKAQESAAHLGYVYPAGGRAGTTFAVTVGGQFIESAREAYISGPGVKVRILEHNKLISQKQQKELRAEEKALLTRRASANKGKGGKAWTPADEKRLADIQKKLANYVRKPASPAIADQVVLEVTLAQDAEPGRRELRLSTPLGLTNPLLFLVDQLPEVSKIPARVSPEVKVGLEDKFGDRFRAPDPPLNVPLPVVINGQIAAGGVDQYRFAATKGMRLVLAVKARELIPYIPDAVPGWFQATLTLYDEKHNEVAYDDDFRFHPDPVMFYEIPQDGKYVLEIKDAVYRGREDFVYRITVGELPFVTSIFPLGGPVGQRTAVELTGWNLPGTNLVAEPKEAGVIGLTASKNGLLSNRAPFAADTLPECRDQEPNDVIDSAQKVTLPMVINGRIDPPGDLDVFRFEGQAGQQIIAEVQARRLDSPLDSIVRLFDAQGRQLAFNDDYEDKGSGLNTHHADSYLMATLPANGVYCIQLADAQRKGGPEYGYRLRISSPQPDFALRVTPSSLSAAAGGNIALTAYALRKDGFTNEIVLGLKDAPAGFRLNGAKIPAGQDQVQFTLNAPTSAARETIHLRFQGAASIQGKPVVHNAVAAEDMMQAFAYRHLVPAGEQDIAVIGGKRGSSQPDMKVMGDGPVKIPVGGTAQVRIASSDRLITGGAQLKLSEPPDGIDIQKISASRDGVVVVFHCDAAKVKPGLAGNLILSTGDGKSSGSKNAKRPVAPKRTPDTLPAIPFEIVAK